MTLAQYGYQRIATIVAILAFFFTLSNPAWSQEMSSSEQDLKAELVAVMDAVKSDWNAGNYDKLKSHWDISDTAPIYIAEESDVVMTSWPQIEDYWIGTDKWNEWIVIDYYNYHVKRVDASNAIVTFDLRFDVKLNDRPNAIGGDNRGVVSLRKVDETWKIYSWVEAPLAAITYMRKLYELNARDDLKHQQTD